MDQIKNHPLYRRHNLDSAMNSFWNYYKSNFISLFLISLVMAAISQIISTMVDIRELQSMTDPAMILEKMKEYVVPAMIIMLVSAFMNIVLQHYIIFRPVDEENNILSSVLKAFRYYIPFLLIMIMFVVMGAIGMVLGVLALIIGAFFVALYLLTLYVFILPLLMIEGPDIGNTISRTFSLAHRNFWSNMGMVAVFMIIMIVVSIVLSSIIMIPFAGTFVKTIFNPEAGAAMDVYTNPVFIILSSLAGALTIPVIPIISCILYFNGRAAEEEENKPPVPHEWRPSVEDLYSRPEEEKGPTT